MKYFLIVFILLSTFSYSQQFQTPLQKSKYKKITSYDELVKYLDEITSHNSRFRMEYFAESAEGRRLPVLFISKGEFGKDKSKIKVMIFAQQHGDEPSGKEGALMLAGRFASGELDTLLSKIDFILIPQMNPDGNEKDTRRNGNNADLNRDHLTLLQPETQGLQRIFYKYLPEACMDVHEYGPFSESWIKSGYIKNFDEQVGTLTNPNIPEKIRNYSDTEYLPFIKRYLNDHDFSYQEYILDGPPDIYPIRYSTYDINDGRQNPGIMNSFSFIQEGLNNSKENQTEHIKKRSLGQETGMIGFLNFIYLHKKEIKKMINQERENLINDALPDKVAIQMKHVKNGESIKLNLLSLCSDKDTTITSDNFHPVVVPTYEVSRPLGYLIPKNSGDLVKWTERQQLKISSLVTTKNIKVEEYFVTKIDSIDFEGDIVINPELSINDVTNKVDLSKYLFVPVAQLQNNLIVQALEPKSIIGLATYKNFDDLVKQNSAYPVLRVVQPN